MKEHLHLGNTNAVLLEIQKLVKKRDHLETISRYKNYRNVKIMFSPPLPPDGDKLWITVDIGAIYVGNRL